MYFTQLATLTTFLSLASTHPTLSPRSILAGGPSITPIPSNCTLQTVHPSSGATAFSASAAFNSAHEVYTIHFPPGFDPKKGQQQCLEQCYGFGNPEQCIAAIWARNVTYQAYGATNSGDACVMYGKFLCKKDLVDVKDGEYLDAIATNIRCPSPRSP